MAKRIAIVGVGAIGGYFGGHMIHGGLDPVLIDAWPENVERIREHGLAIDGMAQDSRLTVKADIRHIGEVQSLIRERPVDIALIAVKSYDTAWATQLILPYLSEKGAVVSLQNAINEPVIAAIAGTNRTFGCAITALACDMTGAGHVQRMSASGSVSVGAMEPGHDETCEEIAAVLSHAEETSAISDLMAVKWSKLVINAMRNSLSAMTGMTGGERDSDPVTLALGIRLGAQTVRVARALGYSLPRSAIDFDTLVAADDGNADALAQMSAQLTRIANSRSSEQRPSMAQDIRKGRRTETNAINGFIAGLGRDLGIDTAAHQRVHELILRIEKGEVSPSPKLADGIM